MDKQFYITKLNTSELNNLYEFMRPLWQETYLEFLPQKQVDFLLKKYFSPENIKQFLAKGYEYYSVNGQGVLVFYYTKGGIYLDKLYLLPQARGKNYPQKVFEFLLSKANFITLNVNQNNKRAVNCYLKNGFKIIKKEIINLPNEMVNCDFVMRKEK